MEDKEKENYLKAIENYEKILQKNPNDGDAYYNLGWTYEKLEKFEKAIDNYNKALELNSNDPAAIYYNLGLIYGKLGNYNKAIENYNKALELNSNDANIYDGLGLTYINIRNYNEAIEILKKALELNPNDANIYYNLGSAYKGIASYEKAIENYNKALELNPNDPAVIYYDLGRSYQVLKKEKESIESFEKALDYIKKILKENSPNDIKNYYNLGLIYKFLKKKVESTENFEKALKCAKDLLKSESDNIKNYFNIGRIYIQLGKANEASKAFSKALELNPNDIESYTWLVWAYDKLEKYNEAIEVCKEVLKITPNKSFFEKQIKLFERRVKKQGSTKRKNIKENEIINLEIVSNQKESKKIIEKNFLTFADILGWKGIWQRDKNKNSKSRNIDKMKSIKENLINAKDKLLKEIQYTDNNIESIANINLISDTFIIASNDIKIHNKLCKELVTQCLKNDLLIRGATAYGEYLSEDMIYIGEAVDEAASWHELAEEIAIFYTISARLKLEDILEEKIKELNKGNKKIKLNNYLREIELINSEVQLKKGKMDTYLISWIDNKENTNKFKEIMKKETIYPELSLKYLNTEKQINNFKDNLRYKKEK